MMQLRSRSGPINNLSHEILVHILSFLSCEDKCRAAMVCRLWRDVALTKGLWKEVFLDHRKERCFSRKINPSIRLLFTRYIGYSLEYLTIKSVDNYLLKHLKQNCPKLEMLVLEDGDYTKCDFSLLPSCIGYLEISICDPKGRNFYPPKWYKDFTSERFPNLDTLKVEGAPDIDDAIVHLSSMKALNSVHVVDINEVSPDAFDKLMTMTWLHGLGITQVSYLPSDFATKIVRNLPNLWEVDFRVTNDLITSKVVRQFAKLQHLSRLLIPCNHKVMKALTDVVLRMSKLKYVEFDVGFHFGDPAPRDLKEILETLQKLRPDVEYVFRDVKVRRDNYEYILNKACTGETNSSDEEEEDSDDNDDSDLDDDERDR